MAVLEEKASIWKAIYDLVDLVLEIEATQKRV